MTVSDGPRGGACRSVCWMQDSRRGYRRTPHGDKTTNSRETRNHEGGVSQDSCSRCNPVSLETTITGIVHGVCFTREGLLGQFSGWANDRSMCS